MITRNVPTIWRRVVWSIAGLNLAMMLVGLALQMSFSQGSGDKSIDSVVSLVAKMLNTPIYTLLAVLIISRHPRHAIGWLFLTVGFFMALGTMMIGTDLQAWEYYIRSYPRLVVGLLAVVGQLTWMVAFMIPISLALQFFPDGRLPSRRWWPITAAMLLGMFGYATSFAFHPWPWEEMGIYDSYNPLASAGSEGFFDSISSMSLFLISIGIGGSLVAVVVRFFRSSGIERSQMKWLVYTTVVITLSLFLLPGGSPVMSILFVSAPTILSLVIGITILRHRLWDIDIIIRRTLIYSLLTAILAGVYFGSVVLVQQVFRAALGQTPDVVIVISTLIVAALFAPLRRNIQNLIDRRLYRRKYDAEKTLEAFSRTLRDEVDIETLKAQLVGVVNDTMQPTKVGLWLPKPNRES